MRTLALTTRGLNLLATARCGFLGYYFYFPFRERAVVV
jgi:hypothetical protein